MTIGRIKPWTSPEKLLRFAISETAESGCGAMNLEPWPEWAHQSLNLCRDMHTFIHRPLFINSLTVLARKVRGLLRRSLWAVQGLVRPIYPGLPLVEGLVRRISKVASKVRGGGQSCCEGGGPRFRAPHFVERRLKV
jgi:hypothetical protein